MLKKFEFEEMLNKLEFYSKSAKRDVERDVFTLAKVYIKILIALYGGKDNE